MPNARHPSVLVDSDGGADDIAALWYLLTVGDCEVVAITTTDGNVDATRAADNLARVAQLAGRPDIPIAIGDGGTYGPHPDVKRADFIHGADGVGNTGRRPASWTPHPQGAIDTMSDAIDRSPAPITVLTLGPLTNLARFVDARPDYVRRVGQVVAMGGTVAYQGNALPIGEANVAHDPLAASVVVTADWARPPLLVGLDATLSATLTATEFELLAAERTPAASDLHAVLDFYRTYGGTFSPPGQTPCHDLTAAIVALEPDLVTSPQLPLGVDTSGGLGWGTTVVDRRRPYFERAGSRSNQNSPPGMAEWRVALQIDVEETRVRYRRLFGESDERPRQDRQ